MVRLGIIGDTQGRYRIDRLLNFVSGRFRDVDEIWHAGDWQDEAVLDGLRALGKPLVVVNGNAPDDPRFPERVERRLEAIEIGMVHRPPKARDPWAAGLDICVHGHTHRWRDEVVGRTRFINVSTPTAAGFSPERSMGILTLRAGAAELEKVRVP
jgi:predicted phosphodiesterase